MHLFTDASSNDGWGAYWSGLLVASSLVSHPEKHGHYMEENICYCDCHSYLGTLLAKGKDSIPL